MGSNSLKNGFRSKKDQDLFWLKWSFVMSLLNPKQSNKNIKYLMDKLCETSLESDLLGAPQDDK